MSAKWNTTRGKSTTPLKKLQIIEVKEGAVASVLERTESAAAKERTNATENQQPDSKREKSISDEIKKKEPSPQHTGYRREGLPTWKDV